MCQNQGKLNTRLSIKHGDTVYIGGEQYIYLGLTCNGKFGFKSVSNLKRRYLTKDQFNRLVSGLQTM